MGNYLKDNDDLRFYVEKALDWKTLYELTEMAKGGVAAGGFADVGEAVAFYREILDLIGGFVADEIGAHTAELDTQKMVLEDGEVIEPPRQKQIFEQIKAMELHAMCLPRELGGMNGPAILYQIQTEIFSRADVSIAAHHGFHGGIALAMLMFSLDEGSTEFDLKTGTLKSTRFEKEIAEIAAGEAWGCMDITEPDAGSDMAKLRASAKQDKDGVWRLNGQKIFITSGHGKYHFVIARTEEASEDSPFAGLKGLSFFLVKTYEDQPDGTRVRYATVERLEEKLGHHPSATCAIALDDTPGELIGKRGDGFRHMLLLMNNARVGVGFECIGLCEAALRMAEDYAAERESMGKPIAQHEMIADYLDEMRTDIQGLRALAMRAGFLVEVAQKKKLLAEHLHGSESEEGKRLLAESRSAQRKARRLTPLLKYIAAEKAVEISRMGLQIHGGVGYTTEYGAEKLVRDAAVMPIYEGTSQIQSLMAMKDTLSGVMKEPQVFVKRMAQARWAALANRKDPLERRIAKMQLHSYGAIQHLISKTAAHKLKSMVERPITEWSDALLKDWDPKRDFAYALLHAERLTKILTDVATAEVLYKQAKQFPERRELLERFVERAEWRVSHMHDVIVHTGQRLLEKLASGEEVADDKAA